MTQLAHIRRSQSARRIVQSSPAMVAVLKDVRCVARDEGLAVLLSGPSGSGKSTYARLIHNKSTRHGARFVAQNCAAVPDTLLESELFGVDPGGHSAAHHARAGLFEEADGGTLFLDEVAQLSPIAQAKLLTVLDGGMFRRVGSTAIRHADFRLITATNADLPALVKSGHFREDLYFRIVGYEINLPGLDKRPEDIVPIARDILDHVAASLNESPLKLTPAAEELLISRTWSGNIRELERSVRRAFARAQDAGDKAVDTHHLDDQTKTTLPSLEEATENYRRAFIARALERTQGNKVRAAKALGISRSSLYKLLCQYGLMSSSRPRAVKAAKGSVPSAKPT